MVLNRHLDKHSVNTDSQYHLAAVASFARNALDELHAQSPCDFSVSIHLLRPVLDRFLQGDCGDETMRLLRETIPAVRDSTREMLFDLDKRFAAGLSEADLKILVTALEFGTHVEAVMFAIFPERWTSLNLGFAGWNMSEVFKSNVFWVREGIPDAERAYELWQEKMSRVGRRAV